MKIIKIMDKRKIRVCSYVSGRDLRAELRTCEITDKDILFRTLHEFGHVYHKHMYSSVTTEVAAWKYAFRCVREKYVEEFLDSAEYCLNSYIRDKSINTDKYTIEDAIIGILDE